MSASTRSQFRFTGAAGVEATRGQFLPALGGQLDVRASIWSFGDVFVTDIELSPLTIAPMTPATVDQAELPPIEFVSIYLLRSGSFVVTNHGDRLHFGEGSAAFTINRGRASGCILTLENSP